MENHLVKWAAAAGSHALLLQKLSVNAGNSIMDVYSHDFEVMEKEDSSPLTQADLTAHHLISTGLKALPTPLADIPVISEEGEIPDYAECASWEAWWLIDPLDGTKEFVKRNGEFTVNIALIVRESDGSSGVPIAGWVYAPVPEILYQGIKGKGAHRFDISDTAKGMSLPVELPMELPAVIPRIVASRSHRNPETEAIIKTVGDRFGEGEIISSGSSLKLCRIAEGTAELYPRPAPTMEWDTAAADAVCRAAGVRVIHALTGENLEYGKENLLNPWFLVSRDKKLLSLSKKVLKEMK